MNEYYPELYLGMVRHSARTWKKLYPCIQNIALYLKTRTDEEDHIKYVIVVTVPEYPSLQLPDDENSWSEEEVQAYKLREYYNWKDESCRHIHKDIKTFYRDSDKAERLLNPFDTSTQLPDINPSLGTMFSLSLHYCDLKERHNPSVEGIEFLKDYIKLLDSEYNNLHESPAEEATRETPSTGLDFGELEKQFHSFLENICPEIEDFWNSIPDEIEFGNYDFSSWEEATPDQRRKIANHLYDQRQCTYLLSSHVDHLEPYGITTRSKRKFVVEVLKKALQTDKKLKPIWINKEIKKDTDELSRLHNIFKLHKN